VSVPAVGSIALPDLCVVVLCALAISVNGLDSVDVLSITIALWTLIAGAANLSSGGVLTPALFLRTTVRLVPYWVALPVLRRLPPRDLRKLVTGAVVIAIGVTLLHLYIVLTKNQELLVKLYYAWSVPGTHANDEIRQKLQTHSSDITRAIPDGMTLITSVCAGCMAALACAPHLWRQRHVIGVLLICGLGALITLTRSVAIVLLIGVPLIAALTVRRPSTCIKVIVAPLALLSALALVDQFAELKILEPFAARVANFANDYAGGRGERIVDTNEGLQELSENVLCGLGVIDPLYKHTVYGSDAHGLVRLALLGGVPLVVLVILVSISALRWRWHGKHPLRIVGLFVVLHEWLLIALGATGGFVWIRCLVPMILGFALLTSKTLPAVAAARRPHAGRRDLGSPSQKATSNGVLKLLAVRAQPGHFIRDPEAPCHCRRSRADLVQEKEETEKCSERREAPRF
jgi:hypothetical protein